MYANGNAIVELYIHTADQTAIVKPTCTLYMQHKCTRTYMYIEAWDNALKVPLNECKGSYIAQGRDPVLP